MVIAEELAKKQREIGIAEFFEKNKHLLGFSNPSKSLITCVKEAVDNALDACEEAGILPDILVKISRLDRNTYRVIIEDNGPGIVKEQIPKIFGKLLYGSRFHAIRQSRGQQGIGISSAVLYAQLTTGKPAVITSRTSPDEPTWKVSLFINTRANEPEIVSETTVDWYRPHGTRIELEIEGAYVKERKQSVYEYLKETSVVNPHAKITFIDPDGETHVFDRVTEEMPQIPVEIKPHPHGIELGQLMAMLKHTKTKNLKNFLKNEFVRVGGKTADEVLAKAGLDANLDPKSLGRDEAVRLLNALRETKFLPPPTDCLSPIGEELITRSLLAEYKAEWVHAVARKPKVYSGHPFFVEVGIAYGGEIPADGKATLLRYANKIPLLYQQGGCALTKAVESVNWKNYGLRQNKGELPEGPVVILVHVASTNVPYTSESKEAVEAIPEIMDEVKKALQEVGRKLKDHISRKERLKQKKKKEDALTKILPLLADKLGEILEREPPAAEPLIAKIVGNILVDRAVVKRDGLLDVTLTIANFMGSKKKLKVYERCDGEVESDSAKVVKVGDSTALVWEIELEPGEEVKLSYRVAGKVLNDKPIVEGVEPELVTVMIRIFGSVLRNT